MKILNHQAAILSNYEVLEHLLQKSSAFARRAQKERGNNKQPGHQTSFLPDNVNEIIRDTIRDLTSPQAVLSCKEGAHTCSTPAIEALVQELKPYHLAKAEYLMILNLRPRNLAELNVVVEELDTRFPTEGQQQEIVDIIVKHLGRGLPPVNTDQEEQGQTAVSGNDDRMVVD